MGIEKGHEMALGPFEKRVREAYTKPILKI